MKKLTLAFANTNTAPPDISTLLGHPLIERILWLRQPQQPAAPAGTQELLADSYFSGTLINKLLAVCRADYLLLVQPGGAVEFGARALERLVQVADDTEAGWLYSDFRERNGAETTEHPLIDYQLGSLRDTFDFGSVILLSRAAAQTSLQEYGAVADDVRWGGLYDLRLKLSTDFDFVHLPEALYTRIAVDTRRRQEEVCAVGGVVNAISRTNIDPQLAHTLADRAHIAGIAIGKTPDAHIDPCATFEIAQTPQPNVKHIGPKKLRHG